MTQASHAEMMELPDESQSSSKQAQAVNQHIVEIVSDSGEGAQTAGQLFGSVSAKMGNGVWTVEIIPAEIEPPARSRPGASGNRIRLGSGPVTNAGDTADVVIAFNEQVLYGRIDTGAYGPHTHIYLDQCWATHPQASIRQQYASALANFHEMGFTVHEIPMEAECKKIVPDPRKGKNMWVVGFLAAMYGRDMDLLRSEVSRIFKRKGPAVLDQNLLLVQAGYDWASQNVPVRYSIPVQPRTQPTVVMNGNQAIALGVLAAGIDLVAMYPITPATSASHYLASIMPDVGAFLHQAEDEIAAIGFALGASYAGKTTATITSGPGLALKTEFIGLAVMAELPLVLIVVQRGGPSTGLPTKVEQGDLLAALYASPGDSPKIILAPSTIEECFHIVIEARELAERYRGPVIVLTDANLATGQQPFKRPDVLPEHFTVSPDQSPWPEDKPPFNWDINTGLSPRPVPGQRNGAYVLTGLAHDENSHVAYESADNQRAMQMRSRKLAAFQRTLKPPKLNGTERGDLLVVGWGSTRGAIEEAVARLRDEGAAVSSLHLRYLSPLEPGLKNILSGFRKVVAIEINYSDDPSDPGITSDNRRFSQLAWILRAHTLVDVDCWSRVPGNPIPPAMIEAELRRRLTHLRREAKHV